MAYSKGGKIEQADINTTLVGSSTTTSTTNINTVWAVGNGKSGYGQTAISTVSTGNVATAARWAQIINTINSIASHQGTAVTSYSAPSTGNPIVHLSALQQNITNIYNGRNNAAGQAPYGVPAGTAVTVTNNTSWLNYVTFTHTVSFASGDAARYFFNAGGQLALTFGHPTGAGINNLFNSLASAAGTIVISGNNAGLVTIAGGSYSGVTKVGGSGTVQTLLANYGYWGLLTTDTEIFKQFGAGVTGYTSSFLSVNARVSSSTGSNGDNGATITITTTFDEVPNGLINSAGTNVTLTLRPPSTTYLTNTWGTVNADSGQSISVTGSVTGA